MNRTTSTMASSGTARQGKEVRHELSVLVGCNDVACAIPTSWVIRLLLPEGIRAERGIVHVGDERYAAWDLGERLDIGSLRAAWILLQVPIGTGKDTVRLALRTGTCLAVRPISSRTALPPSLFASRAGAVRSVFALDRAFSKAGWGLELDLSRLWSPSELAASRALLEGPRG